MLNIKNNLIKRLFISNNVLYLSVQKHQKMRIPFKQLIAEYNLTSPVKLNKNRLADEMVRSGVFKSKNSALTMMWYNESGKNKSIDDELYKFTLAKFNKKGSEILID